MRSFGSGQFFGSVELVLYWFWFGALVWLRGRYRLLAPGAVTASHPVVQPCSVAVLPLPAFYVVQLPSVPRADAPSCLPHRCHSLFFTRCTVNANSLLVMVGVVMVPSYSYAAPAGTGCRYLRLCRFVVVFAFLYTVYRAFGFSSDEPCSAVVSFRTGTGLFFHYGSPSAGCWAWTRDVAALLPPPLPPLSPVTQ